jgi:hypothetical protein
MNNAPARPSEPARLARLLILLAGLVAGQVILYGPSLIGRKVLLPLDILTAPNFYLPQTAQTAGIQTQNHSLTDLICQFEPERRFARAEWLSGRIPMWAPYHYGGVPFTWPKFSPFLIFQCCTESPVVLAWSALVTALVGGLGMYLFLRRVSAVSFWAAAICAWCYPLTGFFIFWQAYPTSLAVYWLPWILLAVDQTVAATNRLAPISLSVLTALTLVSGRPDVGCQVLLASGLYALWRLADVHGRQWFAQVRPAQKLARTVMTLTAAWALGFLLASPYMLPLVEYSRTGARMARRSAGAEERPPIGLSALPQAVLPDIYGAMESASLRCASDHQAESSAAGYAGVGAALLMAPLAFSDRKRLPGNLLWSVLALFGLSWCLNVPGVVQLLRLPGLNMMSHNRLAFITCFAILALAASGLEVFLRGPVQWRWWMRLAQGLLAGLCVWCIYRSTHLPESIRIDLPQKILQGTSVLWVHDLKGVERVQSWFVRYYSAGALWCGLGVLGWVLVRARRPWQARLLPVLAVFLVGELLWFGCGRNVQCDPALYYPPVPSLQALAKAPPGRIIGFACLPPCLASMCGLRDVRGYDAVDPARITDLLLSAADPNSAHPPYGMSLWLAPKAEVGADGNVRLAPVLDMLNVRYVIFRETPAREMHPIVQGPDYYVLENAQALPRAYVPRRVELVADSTDRLKKLALPEFNPREIAYLETPVNLPDSCRGAAELVQDTTTRVRLALRMETPGLVVLADAWNKGWHAYLNGQPVPILRANHALRGVVAPAGTATLEFRYEPASFRLGLGLAGAAALLLLGLTLTGRALPRTKVEVGMGTGASQ